MDISEHIAAQLALKSAMERARGQRSMGDYGAWAFIAVFDDDDIEEFLREVDAAIVSASFSGGTSAVDDLLRRWRISAHMLSDPVASEILNGLDSEADWIDAASV